MTAEQRPILALPTPEVGKRLKQSSSVPPRVSKASGSRQGERLNPQFRALTDAFDHQRADLSDGQVDEVDPELVLVFDLAGTVDDFYRAVEKVPGLEFLTEYSENDVGADDDFHMVGTDDEESGKPVARCLYLVMSNSQAAQELVRLFGLWQENPAMEFQKGLTRFRYVFEQLRAIRPWGTQDRIRDTGLLESWREYLDLVGQSATTVPVEIELWYRKDAKTRAEAESHLRSIVQSGGGEVKAQTQIDQIGYHALLVELPVNAVREVLQQGAESIRLLTADEIMFATPHEPMSVSVSDEVSEVSSAARGTTDLPTERPRIALLDGLPFQNHDLLVGRLDIDDPEELEQEYPVATRRHGTSMASLIVHGDLSAGEAPLDRKLHVRPIMKPHEFHTGSERVLDYWLFPDLLHRAIVRMQVGENGREASAPSVRIINLSIGAPTRALVRRMSPVGRLLDWLAVEFNLLFVVSAGNHRLPLTIPATAATDLKQARDEAVRSARSTSRLRGILPPGDAINALTIGATHRDASADPPATDTVWDLTDSGAPAHYGAVGPGVNRSIKPDIYHAGGRALYQRPLASGDEEVTLISVDSSRVGPGTLAAAPDRMGGTSSTAYSFGTSNAAALVSRKASSLFDMLEAGTREAEERQLPDPLFHPVLVRALLVHASSWGNSADTLKRILSLDPRTAKRELTALLGYGSLDEEQLGLAATNRAVLVTGGLIGGEERHTYTVPLPSSLRRTAGWHRVTVTLASMAPTRGDLTKYRAAKVFFSTVDEKAAGGGRAEADHHAVKRGSCQHEIIEGYKAMAFGDGEGLPIHVQCMKDAVTFKKADAKIRYGLVVSVETKVETSNTIYDEIRAQLQVLARAKTQTRV